MAVSQKESPTLANHNSSRLQEAQHTKLHIAATKTSPKRANNTSNLQKTLQAWTNKIANLVGSHAAPAIKPQPKQ
jgi:hypothetical protein